MQAGSCFAADAVKPPGWKREEDSNTNGVKPPGWKRGDDSNVDAVKPPGW